MSQPNGYCSSCNVDEFDQPTETISDDEWIDLEEAIGNRLVVYELDENYFPTPDGVLCEDILEKLARMD